MQIVPISVDYNNTKCIGKCGSKDILGYWTCFKWQSIEGYAYLFPYGEDDEIILDKAIYVETQQGLVLNFNKLESSRNDEQQIKPLEAFGDYYICGKVIGVLRNDENEIDLVDVKIFDGTFSLESDEVELSYLVEGDIVEFSIVELELYDEGYC